MLFKKFDEASGKTLKTSKPLLVSAAKGYVRPPETGSDWWQTTTSIWPVDELIGRRIRDWRRLTNETGHSGERAQSFRSDHNSIYTGTHSVFPVPLVEWIYLRYAGYNNTLHILDCFAGGPPRALVSSVMGFKYTGYEIRQEQIDENIRTLAALGFMDGVSYKLGDGTVLDGALPESFDFALTCPPYYNLEKYSDLESDLSNLPSYEEFNQSMFHCARAHFRVMKPGSFVCIVVSNFRDKSGELIDFRGDTVCNFREVGFKFHQDVILSRNFASAAVRASNAWKGKKLVPRHEHLLVFIKPEVKHAKTKRVRFKE
jgi:hypothetical protein